MMTWIGWRAARACACARTGRSPHLWYVAHTYTYRYIYTYLCGQKGQGTLTTLSMQSCVLARHHQDLRRLIHRGVGFSYVLLWVQVHEHWLMGWLMVHRTGAAAHRGT